jgi:translocation and assembly module TamB
MGEDGLTPALRDEPWSARLRLDRTPAEPVLALLPWVRQPDGGLDGTVTVRGRGTDIVADGEIALRDVSFIVTDPVFRVERLNGAIGFERGAVVLRDLGMRDRDGTVSVDGRLGLEGLYPRDFRLAIVADGMPLRNEGVVFAFADANIDVEGHLSDEEREVRATFDDFSIELPQELGHSVQGLGQHPDVIYEDQPGFFPEATATGDALVPDEADDPAIPTRVIVDATQPFWIRRDDFSIQLTADLRIDSDDRGARITGLVQVKRGFINLVGRSFDFEDGEIVFDGGRRVDPTLDLSAIHTLESRETVTVNISGRLSNPTINFTTTVPGAETEAEIIALLVSGRGGSAMQAKDQAVSVLGGMAASFISSMTRRTAGAYIPRLSIESTSNSTRVRAGISADALIPEFLDEIVESAYVEGFVGQREGTTTAGGDTTSSGATGGFLIELYWPRSIVTTGTYEQPVNWSLDLTWEP